jgi:hypothetical protein
LGPSGLLVQWQCLASYRLTQSRLNLIFAPLRRHWRIVNAGSITIDFYCSLGKGLRTLLTHIETDA